ncbi:hypothetical protein QPK87_39105 [Kamptonema cortianum]|nr:hypothetical protein [Geitlerinema splendidum]MDK3162512.1 hypothetical protein [Kamptonema cortianum]
MTGRERLVASSRGGQLDRQPLLWLGEGSCEMADGVAVGKEGIAPALLAGEQAVLCWVDGVWLESKGKFSSDDLEGQARALDSATETAKSHCQQALADGADGICYRLAGAEPAHSSPMEYGGLVLERDREVLESVAESRLNVVYVENEGEAYLDFLTDLPCHFLAWNGEAPSTLDEVRALRGGAVADDSSQADAFCARTKIELENYSKLEAKSR